MNEAPDFLAPIPRPPAGSGFRRWRAALLWAVAGGAALGHWLFWYAPRERAAKPSPPFEQLLAGQGGWDRVLWLAHPHQNLGVVDRALGSLDDYLAELTRVAGLSSPELPRFGPFAIPPSSEIALGWSDDGARLFGAARVHRGVRLVARLAGRVAGNPWLSGGEVLRSSRTFRVRWDGPLWIVESGAIEPWPTTPESVRQGAAEPMLAEARLRRPIGALPAGRLRLARGQDGLEIRGGILPADAVAAGPAEAGGSTLRLDLPDLALWVAIADRGPIGGPGLFLLWEEQESLIPRVAVLQRGAGRTFRLPGESLFELLGKGGPELRLGWSVRGTDGRARREGLRIVPWLERNYPRPSGRGAWLAAAGRLAPRRAARVLNRLAGDLRKFPLAPRHDLDRLEASARLLAPLADCPRLTFEIWRDPDGVLARLCPAPEAQALQLDLSTEEDSEIDEAPQVR